MESEASVTCTIWTDCGRVLTYDITWHRSSFPGCCRRPSFNDVMYWQNGDSAPVLH